jgi:hypothetical protein
MRAFYEHMVGPLAAAGRLRLMIGRADDADVAFILGGVFAGEYRGLQFSHDARYRALGLGNVSQLAQIEALCRGGPPHLRPRHGDGLQGALGRAGGRDRAVRDRALIAPTAAARDSRRVAREAGAARI